MSAICISFDTVNILKYGSLDLRNRVVGTRVLLEGSDPYFFKWIEIKNVRQDEKDQGAFKD